MTCATPEEIEYYMEGQCHVLAVALHRNLGWQMEVIRQDDETWWQDEQDPDNFISAVLHVYAIDHHGLVWDIRGVRSQDEINEDLQTRYHTQSFSGDTCRNEGELATYVGIMEDDEGDEVELPLWSYTDQEVETAWNVAQRALGSIPGFGTRPQRRHTP